ncbi:uncharacterized protein LOC131229382 [Magnolia sinica]|uniref:uncharacterized protein LOC131229382 n=1 Tax=Magnolia sinica TaxID=86752 RepID=UPI002657F77F|nr:uncharacterized protein LOC131229382 [Magnolia sinica]
MDDCLIDTLMEVVANGHKSANGFKKETYKTIVDTVKGAIGISLQEKHVGNHLRTLKRLHFEGRKALSASGFGWDDDLKIVTAPDDVWEDYIRSHPYAQHLRDKAVRRYDELTFLFGNDRASGRRSSTGNIPDSMASRRSRDTNISPRKSIDLNDDTLVLSSDEVGDSVADIHWSYHSRDSTHRAHRSPDGNGNNSVNTDNTSMSRKRAKLSRPCDVIGQGMSEVAKAVKSLTITIHQRKDMVHMSQIILALEQIEGLIGHEILRAITILSKDEQQSASFLSLPKYRRLDFVLMLLASDHSSD